MRCVFENSKHYRNAYADPEKIAQPLGDSFLNSQGKRGQIHELKKGQLVVKHVYDKNNHQILSQRRMLFQKLEEMFKLSELPNKADYVSQACLDFLKKQIDAETLSDLSSKFMPGVKEEFSMVEFAQLIHNPKVDSLFHIENWALTKFILFCEGSNQHKLHYLWDLINRRIIDYPIELQVVDRNNKRQKIKQKINNSVFLDPPSNIKSLLQVQQFIELINQQNKKKDPLYSGVHFYFGDYAQQVPYHHQYLERQVQHLHMLQYYITVLTGILGDGQTAILKLNGTFRHKTFQFLFLLKLIFVKVSLSKNSGSNPFVPDSYVICEYYNKKNGDYVHQQLLKNYHVLSDYGEQKLLIDPKKIFKEDCHSALTRFNDQIIFMGLQSIIKQYRLNSNAEYYPNKTKIKVALPQYFCIKLDELVEQCIKQKPEKMQQGRKEFKKIVEKQADYDMLSGFNFTKKTQQSVKKVENKSERDKKEEKSGKTEVQKYLQAQQKKKQEQNKKKVKKSKHNSSWDRERGVY